MAHPSRINQGEPLWGKGMQEGDCGFTPRVSNPGAAQFSKPYANTSSSLARAKRSIKAQQEGYCAADDQPNALVRGLAAEEIGKVGCDRARLLVAVGQETCTDDQ